MKKANKGDLVYVPSSVMLYTNDLYEGEKWLVDKNKTYEVKI